MSEQVTEPAPIEIEGSDGLALKELTLEDAQAYFDLVDYNRAHLSRNGDGTANKYQKVEDVRDSIENPNPHRLRFGIWTGGSMVGSINLDRTEMEYHGREGAELGYWVGAEHIGHGYAAKALQMLIPFAFVQPGVERLYAQVHKENPASRKTLEKCGFKIIEEDADYWEFDLSKPATSTT